MNSLLKLIRQGEGLTLEFKRKVAHPDKVAREIVAFANTCGGILLIGVDDDKTIYGCKDAEEEIFVLQTFLQKHSRNIQYHIERIPVNHKREVVAFHIEESQRKPEYIWNYPQYPNKESFIRIADKSVNASMEMQVILRHQKDKFGTKIIYGEQEQKLMRYFVENAQITLQETMVLLSIPRKQASILLTNLVRAGILNISPAETGDLFTWKEAD